MKQKKVYLVSTEEYEDYRVEGVFSSRAKAEKFMQTVDCSGRFNDVEEYILDPENK